MPLTRLNAPTSSPNPTINFITPLPGSEREQQRAQQLLNAVAAQLKPVMKAHGLSVNSFEEYEYNKVFLGRNWDAGETIELVLRRADGLFWPMNHLLSVFCHELAHIKHMNHLPAFHKYRMQLEKEVRALRARNYFGDGMYSAGYRLGDSEVVGSSALNEDLPEYICGGAQSNSRSQSLRRRRRARANDSSTLGRTGAQTIKKRKAGARVRNVEAFGDGVGGAEGSGTGRALNEGAEDKKAGAGFRRKANSRTAREQRAAAAEARLRRLQPDPSTSTSTSFKVESPDVKPKPEPVTEQEREPVIELDSDSDDSSSDFEIIPETDADRRRHLFGNKASDQKSEDGEQETFPSFSGSNFEAGPSSSWSSASSSNGIKAESSKSHQKLGAMVADEVRTRKREAVGLGEKNRLGGGSKSGGNSIGARPSASIASTSVLQGTSSQTSLPQLQTRQVGPASTSSDTSEDWTCLVCTLMNHSDYALCAACGTRKGNDFVEVR